jgi:hypothetical protein
MAFCQKIYLLTLRAFFWTLGILAFFGPVLVFLVFFLPLDDGLRKGFSEGIRLGERDGGAEGEALQIVVPLPEPS